MDVQLALLIAPIVARLHLLAADSGEPARGPAPGRAAGALPPDWPAPCREGFAVRPQAAASLRAQAAH